MKKLIALCAVSLALSLSARAADAKAPPADGQELVAAQRAVLEKFQATSALMEEVFIKEYGSNALWAATIIISNRHYLQNSLAELAADQAQFDALDQTAQKALAKMSPNNLVAKLDALNRGTSKQKYSREAVVEALRKKNFEVLPAEPGVPPQIRKIVAPEAPVAK